MFDLDFDLQQMQDNTKYQLIARNRLLEQRYADCLSRNDFLEKENAKLNMDNFKLRVQIDLLKVRGRQ